MDCLACLFIKQRDSLVAAYSDGRVVVWDFSNLNEVDYLLQIISKILTVRASIHQYRLLEIHYDTLHAQIISQATPSMVLEY